MSFVDPVLSARRRALPVYLSPDLNVGRPWILEPRAVTMILSTFFDAGAKVQQTTPWAAAAKRFFCLPQNQNTMVLSAACLDQDAVAASLVMHPSLNAYLMHTVCPSRVLRAKVLLSVVESELRNIQHVCCQ